MTAETDRRARRAGLAPVSVKDILASARSTDSATATKARSMMFTRSVPVEAEVVKSDRTGRTVEAYAAVFMTPTEIVDQDGHYREQNAPDAFNKSVAERKGQIFCVYNHARALGGMPSDTWSVPLGEVLWIRADSTGLLTATRYSDDPDSDRILKAIRNKALKGMSYTGVFLRSDPELRGAYDEYMPDQDGNLVLVTRQEIALIEFGPTPIPAYETAQVIGVRSRKPAKTTQSGEEDLGNEGILQFPGSEDIEHPIVPPDNPTSIAMWTAHRVNSMSARLAHGRERLTAAREAPDKAIRDDNALQLRNHLAAAIKHGLMLVESVKAHYPDEAREYDAVVRTQGLKLRQSSGSPAPKSTFAHLLQTSLYQMAHAKRHADLLTDDAPDTFEFDADHAMNHVDGAIEHVAKFAQNLRDNYPTEAQWLQELTGDKNAANPEAVPGHARTDPSVKANVVSSNPDGPAPYWKRDQDTILCPNCGLFSDTGSEYCDQCGEGLGEGASPSSTGMSASGTRGPQFKDGVLLVISSGDDESLPVSDDDTVQCPSCGQLNGCDAIFCRRCGASIPSSAFAAALNGANPPVAAKTTQSVSGKGQQVQSSGRQETEGQERASMGDEQERAAGGPAATGIAGMPTLDHPEYRGHHTHAHYSHGGPDEDGDGIHSHGHTHDSGTSHDHGHGGHIRDYVMSSGEERDPEVQDSSERSPGMEDASERQNGMLPPLLHDLYEGDHTHPHDANGEMDDDGNGVHEHSHSHTGDRGHAHSHEEFIGAKPSAPHPASGVKGGGGKQTTLQPSKPTASAKKKGTDATGSSGREDTSDEHERAGVDNSTWDGPAAMSRALHTESPASAFSAICAGRRSGDPKLQATWALPHHKTPGGPPNAAGVRAALGRLSGTQGLTNKSAAQSHLERHMSAIQSSSGSGDGGKKGSSSSGRDPVAATATSREAGNGTGTAAHAEPHSHPAPHVRSGEGEMGASDDRMTIAERMQRQQDVKNRLFEIDEEYMGSELPYDRQQEWKALQSELVIHQRAIEDASARADYLQRVGNEDANGFNPGVAERVDDGQTGYREAAEAKTIPSGTGPQRNGGWKGMAGSSGPQLLSRMNPVYDLTAIRNRARSIDEVPTLYREYASRAIEAARFPGVSNREQAQTNVQRLIDSIDDEMGTLSRRILVTGSPLYERSFGKMVKALSQNGLTTEESRALQLGVDAAGGFAVPFQLDPTVILTYNGVINPLRQISRVEQITGKEWDGVTSTGIVISRATEGQEASDNSPALVAPTVRTTRVQGFVPFSIELDMSWGSMRNQMTQMLADAKDIEEASSFTLGSGGAPNCNGLITTLATAAPANASVQVLTATTAVVAVGDIYNMESNAAPKFRQTSSWLASKTTYNRIRQLFQQFAALAGDPWVRALPGQPAELLGYPAFEASVMSNSIASGQFPLVFGDFSQFLIVDRVGMGIELIPHLFGATNRFPTGQRGLFAIWFNNCQTLAPNAFRILQMR